MKFDVIQVLQDYNVAYIDSHSILTSNFVGLSVCPICHASGEGKPYFAFSRFSNSCSCWICHTRDFNSALKQVLGISDYKTLQDIYKKYGNSMGSFSPRESKSDIIRPSKIELPGSTKMIPPARKYLEGRGFNPEYIWERYSLRSTTYGSAVPYRIVIPIIHDGRNVSYTARSYVKGVEPRYKSCNGALEILPHKETFYGIDNAKRRNVVVVEGGGPDVWASGDNFIGAFGTEVTLAQRMLLADRYDKIFVLFDSKEEEAQRHAREVAITLESVGKNCEIIEFYEKLDPADYWKKYPEELIYMKKDLGV